MRLTLDEIRARPPITAPVAMECGGNGRARLSRRPISAPWYEEAVGCAEWTGAPLGPILEEAGVLDGAVEILFSGHDRGVEQVEFSSDGGRTWEDTKLGEPPGPHAWRPWSYEWDAREPGEYELCARATDASGRTQPTEGDETWNYGGYGVNAVQRVPVIVG